MATTTISLRGAIIIPIELRRKYGLSKGTRITLVDYAGVITLVPALANPIQQARGMLKGGEPLLPALAKEKRRERERGRAIEVRAPKSLE